MGLRLMPVDVIRVSHSSKWIYLRQLIIRFGNRLFLYEVLSKVSLVRLYLDIRARLSYTYGSLCKAYILKEVCLMK